MFKLKTGGLIPFLLFPSEESRKLRSKSLKKIKKKISAYFSPLRTTISLEILQEVTKRNLKSGKRKASWLGDLGPEEQSSRVS